MALSKRIAITGSGGVVGEELVRLLKGLPVLPLPNKGEGGVDVRDYALLEEKISGFKPEVIVHLASKTDVDWCERNPGECFDVNAAGTANIAKISAKFDIPLFYASTLYVYSGEKDGIYDEREDPVSLDKIKSVYSRSKLQGEEEVLKYIKSKYFICRFGAVFGGGLKDRKFVRKILDLSKKEKEIKVVNDRTVTLAYARDLARNTLELIKTDNFGVYNMVNKGFATYYEYAQKILEYACRSDVKLIPIDSGSFKEDAVRPKNLRLVNARLQEIGLDLMPPWEEALKEYIEELKKEGLL